MTDVCQSSKPEPVMSQNETKPSTRGVVAITLVSIFTAFAGPAIAAGAVDPLTRGTPEVAASAFDVTALPSLDSIDAQTDITAFLQIGVPAELLLAALRRAWTADPAIRDFKELSENDWDFNDPNRIAGFGELGPEVDVNTMVAEILGEAPRVTARLEEPRNFSSLANAALRRFLGVTLN
jgi:Protein of unknown function (DUF3306)